MKLINNIARRDVCASGRTENRGLAYSHNDLQALRDSLNSKTAELAVCLLGDPNHALSNRHELRFGNRGSLAVVVSDPKIGLWYNHETSVGGDLFDLIATRISGGFSKVVSFALSFVGGQVASPTLPITLTKSDDNTREAANNRERALAIWDQSQDIAGTVAAKYLQSRALILPNRTAGNALRFHPNCPFSNERHPAMVALLRDILTNEPQAIHRTALTPSGAKIGRKFLGSNSGAAVKLSPDEEVTLGLAIGEGIETTIAGMMLGHSPAWAVGNAGELAKFPVLSGIECLTIFVDHDISGTGQARAIECSKRWASAGHEVFRVIPNKPGADMATIVAGVAA